MTPTLKSTAIALTLIASGTVAQTNPIDGNFGFAGGCNRIADPNAADLSDQTMILRPNRLDTYFMECNIISIGLVSDTVANLSLNCGTEEGIQSLGATITRSPDGNALNIIFVDSDFSAELRRCE